MLRLCVDHLKALAIDMESITVNWSTHFHCTTNRIVECLVQHCSALTSEYINMSTYRGVYVF